MEEKACARSTRGATVSGALRLVAGRSNPENNSKLIASSAKVALKVARDSSVGPSRGHSK